MPFRRDPALTPEAEPARLAFAKAHGRTWKRVRLHHCMQASADPILHARRHRHGPSCLVPYRLPQTEEEASSPERHEPHGGRHPPSS
jgi:hypothetical protein